VTGRGCEWMRANRDTWAEIGSHVELVDYLEHRVLLERLGEHAALFIAFPRPWLMTGKIFEYLRSGLPIFGVAPAVGTEMERVIERAGTGVVSAADDITGGANQLHKMYRSWKDKRSALKPNYHEVRQYDRRELVKRFVTVFEEVASERRGVRS
jgi:hypothetical protein